MNTDTKPQIGHRAGETQMRGIVAAGRVMAALVSLAFLVTGVANADPLLLDDVSHSSLPGDRVQIRFELSADAPEATAFTTDNPARIAIDLPGVALGDVRKSQNIGLGVVRGVQTIEAGGRSRVVINLVRLVPYQIKSDGNAVVIIIGAGDEAIATANDSSSSTEKISKKPAGNKQLNNVDFRRGEHGEGRVIVDLSSSSIVADISEEAGKVVVEFLSTTLPEQLERRLNVLDFATPVATIDTFTRGNNARMEIAATGKYQHLAYQSGRTLVIEVLPVSLADAEAVKKEKEQYVGEKLSLIFQDIEVRAVLQLLADFTGMNLVTSDSVGGNITLRLKNVPWDQALDIILKARGLGIRQTGNIMMVAPNDELSAREKVELEAQQQLRELAPLYNDNIQINYAKAGELAALIKSEDNSLLSERGSITIDERTNMLLLKDTAENLQAIRKLVKELDIAVRQVMIDSRIVLAKDDFNKELGARFGVTDISNNNPLKTPSSTITSGNLGATTQIIDGGGGAPSDRYNVNLPVSNMATGAAGTIGLALARLPLGTLVELELSAAQAEGKSEVVSSPRVITSNQKEAIIEQGVEIPYQSSSGNTGTTVNFKKAVLRLKVTPQITPDDRIIMDLQVNKDSPDYARAVLGQPPINTQNVTTQVLVDNGETIVLGGVYEQSKQNSVNRVPFFSDIPLLGVLFRNTYNSDEKSELLIFVTPKIVKDSMSIN
ncbi:MAG: type IV pilus secretin PilQ [Thiohalomonadaceae bacterium]